MLINSWHPTYAMFRNPYAWGEFKIDLDRFSRAIHGKLRAGPSKICTAPRLEDIAAVAKRGYVSVDVEAGPDNPSTPWTAKFPGLARLRCIGIGNEDVGLSQWWYEGRHSHVVGAIAKLLADPKVKKIYQNGIWYDMPLLNRYRLPTVNFDDTRDMRRACSSTSRLGLKYMATIFDDVHPWAEEQEDDEKLVLTKNKQRLMEYNCFDVVETTRVWLGIQEDSEWREDRVQGLYRIHLATSQLAASMRQRGMWIDPKERKRLADLLEEEYDKREKEFLDLVGIPNFKHKPEHMRALIFKRHETKEVHRFSLDDPYDKKMWTPEGDAIKVDEDTLMQLYVTPGLPKELKAIIKAYWHAGSVWKMRSTFVTSAAIDKAIGYDGFLRCDWNSCGADTGRWSCRNPNVMTIPKDQKGLPNIRRMYAAPPGHVLIEADYKQQELYVMWLVSGDQALGEGLKGDVYTSDAKAIFSLPKQVVKCECEGHCIDQFDPTTGKGTHLKSSVRKASKAGHLAFQYGAGTNAIYLQMLPQDPTVKYDLVKTIHEGLKKHYHQTVKYWEDEMERVRKTGYSETRILHRRRYYPREPPITEVANYPIQGTAADITTLAILEIDRRMKKEKVRNPAGLLGQFHDAVILCVPDTPAWRKRGSQIVVEAMEQEHEIEGKKHRFRVDLKIGYNWADMETPK